MSTQPTDAELIAELEVAGVAFMKFRGGLGGTKEVWTTSGSQDAKKIAQGMRAAIAKWGQSAQAAESVTEPAGVEEGDIDAVALARYKVVPAHESMIHRFAVVAGDGNQQLYLGREVECENMARKFAGAFLDGAFYQANITPPTQSADSVQEDAARLDWLDQQCEGYGFQDIHEGNCWEISGPYANVRQAIDYERAARAPADSVLEDARREVLMEHSGCGSGTQVEKLTVRLNPGDKVVMLKGRITQAIDAASKQGATP